MLLTLFVFLPIADFKATTSLGALWNFEEVTECILHYRALAYNNYGCWCGVGGGHEPVDEIDACCREHDHCYDRAVAEHKCVDVAWEYIDSYNWKCSNNTALCLENKHPCKAALCICDTTVVSCWSKYPKPEKKLKCNRSYEPDYSKWFRV